MNRGAAYADGKIFFNTLDNHSDRRGCGDRHGAAGSTEGRRHQPRRDDDDGAARREGQGARRQQRRRVRRARLAHGARRSAPARIAWRAYSTGPDSDVLIGPRLQAVLRAGPRQGPRRQHLAAGRVEDRRRHGVGLDLVRPRARPHLLRHRQPGPVEPRAAARATTSGPAAIFARDPDTGEAVWFYQFSPHDLYDYDGVNENVLLDMHVDGPDAQGAPAPGPQRLRVRDRSHHRRGAVGRRRSCTSRRAHGVDLKTGALQYEPGQGPAHAARSCATSAPPSPGAKDWQPSAFSPRTGCSTSRTRTCVRTPRALEANYIAGTPYVGAERADVRRARRPSRRAHGVGPGRADARRGTITEDLPGVERRARHRRRRRLLRHDGRLVQGGRRAHRRRSCGSSRPAPESSASRSPTAGPTASSTSRCCPASAAGPARSSPAISIARDSTAARRLRRTR